MSIIQSKPKLVGQISDTALWAAACRAMETERSNALFHDPLAKILSGEKGHKIATHMPGWKQTRWSTAIRTCAIDQLVLKAIGDHSIQCVVNLAAGLDTRPYRLALDRDLHWIEVDFPHVIDFKDAQLKEKTPLCRLERIKLDLNRASERASFLEGVHRAHSRILIIAEGFLGYLSEEQVSSIVEDVNRYPHFKFWVQDYSSSDVARGVQTVWKKQMAEEVALQFAPRDWLGFFSDRGWDAVEKRSTVREAQRLKRETVSMQLKRHLQRFRPKPKEVRNMTGYVLLGRRDQRCESAQNEATA